MYTLRIIEETRENEKVPFESVIENFELGESYSHIKKGCSKEFEELLKDWPAEDQLNVESIICGNNGTTFFVCSNNINRNYSYFIMTESGKTFERL